MIILYSLIASTAFVSSSTVIEPPARPPAFADVDGDGLLDLYATMPGGKDALLRNLGNGRFEDVSVRAGLEDLSGTTSVAWCDADDDGDPDLALAGMNGLRVFINNGGVFAPAVLRPHSVDLPLLVVQWFDFDGDGFDDVAAYGPTGWIVLQNERMGRFSAMDAGSPVLSGPDSGGSGSSGGAVAASPLDVLPVLAGFPQQVQTALVQLLAHGTIPGACGSTHAALSSTLTSRCTDYVIDQATGTCAIRASSQPLFDHLLPLGPFFFVSPSGNVGIRTVSPDARLTVVQDADVNDGVSLAEAGLLLRAVEGANAATLRLAADNANLKTTIQAQQTTTATMLPLLLNPLGGNVGIGTISPLAKLHVNGNLRVNNGSGNAAITLDSQTNEGDINFFENGVHKCQIRFDVDANGGNFDFNDRVNGAVTRLYIAGNGNVGIGTGSPQAKLDVNGSTRTQCLTITGGCDVAEPFAVSDGDADPGMVVVIDPSNPGALMVSERAYDKRVAGIVSGAGGVNTGLTLSQSEVLDGDVPVALTGRVYCWSDATYGAIEAGDRLTTSATRGHAMRVSDEHLSPGAVIGKAMTSLSSGKGLVLVLVNLQ